MTAELLQIAAFVDLAHNKKMYFVGGVVFVFQDETEVKFTLTWMLQVFAGVNILE